VPKKDRCHCAGTSKVVVNLREETPEEENLLATPWKTDIENVGKHWCNGCAL